MGQIKVTDEWLYRYMPVADEAMVRELEEHTDYEYRFTGKFERRMRALMRREAHPWAEAFYRLAKRAAILLLGAVSSLFIVTISVQARRVRFFETVTTMLENNAMRYSYVMDQEPETMQYVEPGYIPEGYWEIDRMESAHWLCVTYSNQKEELFIWDQHLIMDGDEITVDTEYDQQIVKEVNGKRLIVSQYGEGGVSVYCEYGAYVYMLTADNLSIDEVCMMFEAIGE